ncbi:MAG: slipin family protein [Ruminococcaceae bacterium]|nr:slipin family protein [Oscillospiraceae bacterium]
MKTIVIHENQRGLLFKNGRYKRLLGAGKYRLWGGRTVEVCDLSQPLKPIHCGLEVLLADPALAPLVETVEVGDGELALHEVNGNFAGALSAGKHAFWRICSTHSFRVINVTDPRPEASIPSHILLALTPSVCMRIDVPAYHKALLLFNGQVQGMIESGAHYFWRNGTTVEAVEVDTRMIQLLIAGQELLTADKVTLRISLVCEYRVTDALRFLTELNDGAEQIRVSAQLALREYVGHRRLDEILENKEQIAEHLTAFLRERGHRWFVEIGEVNVKDVVLPGEIRDIMNTVLIAEKKAQANVIARREEVASTRSLLNTARLMEENPTLYRLKELEYVERICENVGNITLNGSGDLLAQLTSVLRGGASSV